MTKNACRRSANANQNDTIKLVRIEARSPYSVYKAAGRAAIGVGSAAAKNGLAGPCSSYVCRRRSPMKLPRNFSKPLAIGATARSENCHAACQRRSAAGGSVLSIDLRFTRNATSDRSYRFAWKLT
jgi:hypothetical protein